MRASGGGEGDSELKEPRALLWRRRQGSAAQSQVGPYDDRSLVFDDYRAALRALYAHKKQHEYGFSHRAFSRRAGLKSTNFLKLVMDGERNVSPKVAARFADALGLNATATTGQRRAILQSACTVERAWPARTSASVTAACPHA
jgi:hypothetical protein